MARRRRSEPMPVKYWSQAGLLLTDWCPAECASCYLGCSPRRAARMDTESALRYWRELIETSEHGCRVHLTGGEPMGDWPALIDLCRRARAAGLGPLTKVETNAFWAESDAVVAERMGALDAAGMAKLAISADPYHQQFVPIERARRAARVAQEVLGPDRVQVRWRDWLGEGFDTASLTPAQRRELFCRYAASGRDRYNGRAAVLVAPHLPGVPVRELSQRGCRHALLRSKHVHVLPDGTVFPGVCAGIQIGRLSEASVGELWARLCEDHADRPVLAALADQGPLGLLEEACRCGFPPRTHYAGTCHLCWEIRSHFARHGLHTDEVGPADLYEA